MGVKNVCTVVSWLMVFATSTILDEGTKRVRRSLHAHTSEYKFWLLYCKMNGNSHAFHVEQLLKGRYVNWQRVLGGESWSQNITEQYVQALNKVIEKLQLFRQSDMRLSPYESADLQFLWNLATRVVRNRKTVVGAYPRFSEHNIRHIKIVELWENITEVAHKAYLTRVAYIGGRNTSKTVDEKDENLVMNNLNSCSTIGSSKRFDDRRRGKPKLFKNLMDSWLQKNDVGRRSAKTKEISSRREKH